MHNMHEIVDLVEAIEFMRYVLLDGQLAKHDLVNELGDVLAGLPAAKGGALPDAARHQLERPR